MQKNITYRVKNSTCKVIVHIGLKIAHIKKGVHLGILTLFLGQLCANQNFLRKSKP